MLPVVQQLQQALFVKLVPWRTFGSAGKNLYWLPFSTGIPVSTGCLPVLPFPTFFLHLLLTFLYLFPENASFELVLGLAVPVCACTANRYVPVPKKYWLYLQTGKAIS